MARNAHPELTQERIIQAATELFSPRRAQKRLEAANLMCRTFIPKANPKMIGMEFTALVDERDDFVDLNTQGNQDGSLHADQVEQAAEIIRLLANMWLLPFFRQRTQAELRTRTACFFSVMQGLGIPLEDQGFSDLLASFGTDAQGEAGIWARPIRPKPQAKDCWHRHSLLF